jgi:hypothetical protein
MLDPQHVKEDKTQLADVGVAVHLDRMMETWERDRTFFWE